MVYWDHVTNREAPLNAAAARGDVEEIRRLIAAGASPNERSRFGGSQPLHSAARGGHPEAVRVLIELHSDVKGIDDQRATPLHRAAIVSNGRPLGVDSERGRNAAAIVLLEHGANPNAQDYSENTPLHAAVGGLDVPLIKILMDHGADPNIRNRERYRPADMVPIHLSGSDAQRALEYLGEKGH